MNLFDRLGARHIRAMTILMVSPADADKFSRKKTILT
jgi:hypothetical protein